MDYTQDDSDAVAAVRRGQAEAFGVLVTRYQEVAFRAAYLVLRDSAQAEDAAQEGFVRAYRALGTFRQGAPFRPWLLRIVTNLALNQVRARSRRTGLFSRLARETRDPNPPPDREIVQGERDRLLMRAIAELPADDQAILYLRYFLELPARELAVAIGKAPGTAKSRLHRASGRLRKVIIERYPSLAPGETDA